MREQRKMKSEKGTAIAMITVELDNEYIWHSMGDSYRSPKNTSMGTYGTHRGLLRVLETLKEYGIRATFFIPGMAAEDYPQEVREIAAQGHEVALHGYAHEDFAGLAAEEQRKVLKKGIEALERVTGKRPAGFRLPEGDCTAETAGLLEEEGFLYDNSFFDRDLPYVRPEAKLVEIPMRWETQDFPYFAFGPTFPSGKSRIAVYDEVLDNWLWELEACCEEGYCFTLKVDPQIIGTPGRIFMLERILAEVNKRNIWCATGREIAEAVLAAGDGQK